MKVDYSINNEKKSLLCSAEKHFTAMKKNQK